MLGLTRNWLLGDYTELELSAHDHAAEPPESL